MRLHGPRMAHPRKGPVRRPKLTPGPSTEKFEAPGSVKAEQAKKAQGPSSSFSSQKKWGSWKKNGFSS